MRISTVSGVIGVIGGMGLLLCGCQPTAPTARQSDPVPVASAPSGPVNILPPPAPHTATPLAADFQPAVLADGAAPSIGQAATVVGYGLGREGRPKTGGALRAAALRVREPASKILLWASDPEDGGAGACSGDSGAPIFAEDGKTVLAIVAWTSGGKGHKCGALTQGPLIAPLREWIDTIVKRWAP